MHIKFPRREQWASASAGLSYSTSRTQDRVARASNAASLSPHSPGRITFVATVLFMSRLYWQATTSMVLIAYLDLAATIQSCLEFLLSRPIYVHIRVVSSLRPRFHSYLTTLWCIVSYAVDTEFVLTVLQNFVCERTLLNKPLCSKLFLVILQLMLLMCYFSLCWITLVRRRLGTINDFFVDL